MHSTAPPDRTATPTGKPRGTPEPGGNRLSQIRAVGVPLSNTNHAENGGSDSVDNYTYPSTRPHQRETAPSRSKEACARAVQLLDPYAPAEILCERHTEREPHPGSQEAFDIRARFPWHRQPHTRVMVEVALDEKLLRPTSRRPVLHDYGEPLIAEVSTYCLEEIVAEKLRAILQHARAFENRGWVRSRARDYYDLWRILGASAARLDVSNFEALLREKCATRNVAFSGPDSFFPEAMLAHVEKTWAQWLGPLVPDLPSHERVIADLRPLIGSNQGAAECTRGSMFELGNHGCRSLHTWIGGSHTSCPLNGESLSRQPPLEVGGPERAGRCDEPPGRVHLLPDVPQQHAPHPAASQVIDHTLTVGFFPVRHGLQARVNFTDGFVSQVKKIRVKRREMIV
jgi:nucleotidyltransferase AbiEii toxin of type IV toxin-antitoxin system